jgi:hypothetical protein
MEDNILNNAIDVLEKLKNEEEVSIRFTKADGSIRLMKCTLNFDVIPKRSQPKKIDLPKILKLINKNKILHVYDLEKQEWRAIPLDRIEWLDTSSLRFKVKI